MSNEYGLRKRSHQKWFAGLTLLLSFMLVLSGCGAGKDGQGGSSGDGGKVTLKMMHLWPEGSSAQQSKLVTQIIDQYQKDHPNVVIQQEVLENEQYKNKLKVLSASNELPDIGITWAAGFMEPYVKGGLFTPMDDLLQGSKLKDKFVPGTTEAYALNGKTYALPIELNITPIYYNKAIFQKYNLKVPTTFDEFKQVVKTLTDHGVAPIALGNKDRWTGSLWYMYLADRIAGNETLKKRLTDQDRSMTLV